MQHTTASTVPFVKTVLSKDGTAIAFQRIGHGPSVILVDGALCHRGMAPCARAGIWLNSWHRISRYSPTTLPYDGAIVQDNQRGTPLPARRWATVTAPTLVMDGGKSPQWMRRGNRALTLVLPNAQYRTLDGQTHILKPEAHAPTLVEFFKD